MKSFSIPTNRRPPVSAGRMNASRRQSGDIAPHGRLLGTTALPVGLHGKVMKLMRKKFEEVFKILKRYQCLLPQLS